MILIIQLYSYTSTLTHTHANAQTFSKALHTQIQMLKGTMTHLFIKKLKCLIKKKLNKKTNPTV